MYWPLYFLDKYIMIAYHQDKMPGPRIFELRRYMAPPQATSQLGIHTAKPRRRLRDGMFPPPAYVNEYGLKFLNEAWQRKTRALLKNHMERTHYSENENVRGK